MTQPKTMLCHFQFVLALFSILFSTLLQPSAAYAVPMQAKSHHDVQQGYRYHIVQHGDTLYNISQRYGTTIDAIRQANGLQNSYIQIGWRLAIPGTQPAQPLPNHCYTYHPVQMGETLFSIARGYNIPYHVLLQANTIYDPNNIKAGQQLCIPKFDPGQSPGSHSPQPCPATSCCQTHCPPTATPTEIPCVHTSCCHTHCCQTDCSPTPTLTLTPTPTPTVTPTSTLTPTPTPTLTPTATEIPCVPTACCQTQCCQTDCPPEPTPTLTPMPTEIPCVPTSCCQTECCQTHCPPAPTPVAPTVMPTSTYQGFWHGEYFDTNGTLRSVQYDPEISFTWGAGGPNNMPDVTDNFRVRWTRTQYFEEGNYRFHATVDDHIIVRMDSQPILENWYGNPANERDIWMPAGVHVIQVEYHEQAGDARVNLSWTKL